MDILRTAFLKYIVDLKSEENYNPTILPPHEPTILVFLAYTVVGIAGYISEKLQAPPIEYCPNKS